MPENLTPATEFIARRLSSHRNNPMTTARAMAEKVTNDNYLGGAEEVKAVQQTLESVGPRGFIVLEEVATEHAAEESQARVRSRMNLLGITIIRP